MSRNLDGRAPFIDDLTPVHLLAAAAKWGMSLSDVVALASRLAALGVHLPEGIDWDSVPDLTERQRRLLSRDLDGRAPFIDDLTPVHLLAAAAEWGLSLSDVVALARPLAALGVHLPEGVDWDSVPDLTGRQWRLLSRYLDGQAPFIDDLTPVHLLGAAAKLDMKLTDVVELAEPLAHFGFNVPRVDLPSTSRSQALQLLSSSPRNDANLNHNLSVLQCRDAAEKSRVRMMDAIEILRPILDAYSESHTNASFLRRLTPRTEALLKGIWWKGEEGEKASRSALSLWNFAVAADDLGVPPYDLVDELDKLETIGVGNLDECRRFAEFCRQRAAALA